MAKANNGAIHPDDANVKPEPGPAGFTTIAVSKLKALGLPKKCIGGSIVSDQLLEGETRFCVYEHGGARYGFGYEEGPNSFGRMKTIELTYMDAYEDDTYQQVAA